MDSWNEYYLGNEHPWLRPDPDLMAEAGRLRPGAALDLGCGEGADSLWLLAAGWEVTAVDYAPAAIATAERLSKERGLTIDGVVADLFEYHPEPQYDLVCLCYIHVGPDERSRLLPMAARALVPGGTLLYIGITRPERKCEAKLPAELLARPEEVTAALPGLSIERSDARRRSVGCPEGDFDADVMVVRAVR